MQQQEYILLKIIFPRLKQDHDNARHFAKSLAHIEILNIDMDEVQTNMVFVNAPDSKGTSLKKHLESHNIIISDGKRVRLTFHLDITKKDVDRMIEAFSDFYS